MGDWAENVEACFLSPESLERDVRTHLELAGISAGVNTSHGAKQAGCRADVRRVVLRPVEQVETVETQLQIDVLPALDVLLPISIPVAGVVLPQQVGRGVKKKSES